MKFLRRRLLAAVFHLLALSLGAFALGELASGDVLSEWRIDPGVSPDALRHERQKLHLDDPWWRRYADWLTRAARGDWGTSLASGVPVGELARPRLWRTLQLVLPVWSLSWIAGLALAGLALRLGIWRWCEVLASLAFLFPEVLLASLCAWFLVVVIRLSPDSLWLPALPLALPLTAVIFLHAAGALASARESRYVRIAGRLGVSPRTMWTRYLAPAIANPLLSLASPTLVSAFGSALAVEAITGWPGLGALFVEAFRSRDYPVTQVILLGLGALLIGGTLVADLLLYRLDPRLRQEDDRHAAQ